MMFGFLGIIGAYLLGSISSAVVVCRLMGHPDPRTLGSKNPGATNVLRVAGRNAAAMTLLGDVIKGFVPVFTAFLLASQEWIIAGCALAAFLGHLYPIFFGFKGGKGVATAFGTLIGACWIVGVAVLLTWLATAALFRISSLSALVSAALTPLYVYWLGPWETHWVFGASIIMVTLLVWRHRSNISNIIRGTEKKIGHSSS